MYVCCPCCLLLLAALTAARAWMRDQRLPKEKQAVALEYFRRIYKSRATYEEADILASMPPAMRMDFSTHLYQKFLAGVRAQRTCLCGR